MSYYAGKNGKVSLNVGSTPTTVPVKNWKATHSIGEGDTTSTTSNGKYEVQGLIEKVEGSFQADWNASTSPFSSGLGLAAGVYVTDLMLYIYATDGPSFTVTTAFIKSVDVELSVDAIVTYTCNFVSSGAFTLPT